MSGKKYRPWWDAAECGISTGSTLLAQACLSEYVNVVMLQLVVHVFEKNIVVFVKFLFQWMRIFYLTEWYFGYRCVWRFLISCDSSTDTILFVCLEKKRSFTEISWFLHADSYTNGHQSKTERWCSAYDRGSCRSTVKGNYRFFYTFWLCDDIEDRTVSYWCVPG